MSATELDLPVLISSEQIRRREFVTTRRGYDPAQVRDYLQALADQVDLMATMIREARMEAEAALRADEQRVDPYERLARRVSSVIREADEAAERFRMEGRRDAERMMEDARTEAERIRTEAHANAERARVEAETALEHARGEANRTLAGLSTRRNALIDQLAEMQERLLGVARDLEATIVTPELETAPQAPPAPAPPDPVAAAPGEPRIVEIPPEAAPPTPTMDEMFADVDEDDEMWAGTDTVHLEVPDIPPLDLDWGEPLDPDDEA
jgi:DivIVA domain-containing protein